MTQPILPFQLHEHARTPIDQRAHAVEVIVDHWTIDTEQSDLLEALRVLVRSDLTLTEMRGKVAMLCAASMDVDDLHGKHRCTVEEYNAAVDEYRATLDDVCSMPSERLMAVLDAVQESRPALQWAPRMQLVRGGAR